MLSASSHPLSFTAEIPEPSILIPFPSQSIEETEEELDEEQEQEDNERPRLISRETVRAQSIHRSISRNRTLSESESFVASLPRYLTFSNSPHLLQDSSMLSQLPLGHLQALVIALSRDLSSSREEGNRLKRINGTLMDILLEKGAVGEGELERIKRRAMVEEDVPIESNWRINLEREDGDESPVEVQINKRRSRNSSSDAENMHPSLDLDDLAEAIAENAFSYNRDSQSDQDSEPTINYNTLPISKPPRPRHTSLSSRLFGYPTALTVATPLDPDTRPNGSPRSVSAPRATRSNSIASNSSATSSIKSRESRVSKDNSDSWIGWKPWGRVTIRTEEEESVKELDEDDLEAAENDEVVIGNDDRLTVPSRPSSINADSVYSPATSTSTPESKERHNHAIPVAPTNTSPTRSRKSSLKSSNPFTLVPLAAVQPTLSTPIPVSTISTNHLTTDLTTPSQATRIIMERSSSSTSNFKMSSSRIPTHLEAVKTAAGWWIGGNEKVFQNELKVGIKIKALVGSLMNNVIGKMDTFPTAQIESKATKRRTSLSSISLSNSTTAPTPLSPPSTSSPRSYMSSAKGTLGRAIGLEPNLTLFPKLSSISRFSLFAPPLLANPITTGQIVAGNSIVVKPATGSSTGSGNLTMELSTISTEVKPPTLASTKEDVNEPDGEKPMVDRYGFVYDVRSGMKLLRDSRKRKEFGRESSSEEDDLEEDLERKEAVAKLEVEVEVEAEMEALREALGLPPTSTNNSPKNLKGSIDRSPRPDSPSTASINSSIRSQELISPSSKTPKPVRLARTISSSTTNSLGGPQSMKLLLHQLTSMHDTTDSIQKIAWESFIHRRQLKLAKTALSPSENGMKKKGIDIEEMEEEVIWNENLVGVAQMGLAGKKGKGDWNEFKELIKKGVPITFRPKIWSECSGATEAREPGVYQELLRKHQGEENQCLTQIDMDCHRTFPTNVFFAGNGPGVAKLRNVLIAYSWRNPTIGYCQGMNNLTATLLLTHPAEEDAFWVLCCIIEKILPADYYTSHLLVSQADQRVLKDLIYKHLPAVADHLEFLSVELPAVTFSWFLSLFTDALPIQTLLRIWDLLFVFGPIVLFRTAVAIIQMNSAEIIACDSAANLYALMRTMTTHLYQVDKLLKITFEDGPVIKDSVIIALRARHVGDLKKEMGL